MTTAIKSLRQLQQRCYCSTISRYDFYHGEITSATSRNKYATISTRIAQISTTSSSIDVRSNRRGEGSWEQVEQQCNRFFELYRNNGNNNIKHSGPIMSKVPELLLQCVNNPHPYHSGPMANELLELATRNPNTTFQTTRSVTPEMYALAIEAWIKSGHMFALEEAETLLWELLADRYLKRLDHETNRGQQHDICNRINSAFALVIHAFFSTPVEISDLMDRSERLVTRMKELYNNTEQSATSPLRYVQPNTTAFNAILRVLAKKEEVSAAQEGFEFLQKMAKDQDENKNSKMAPNLVSYSTVMDAFAKCGDADGVYTVLQFMISRHEADPSMNVKPNAVCFNTLLDAWAKSGRLDAGKRAEEVLRWMEDDTVEVEPDSFSYTAVINAWSNSTAKGSADRAEAMLRQMIALQEKGHDRICPDHVSFSAVVDAWAKSGDPSSASRAANIVTLMEELAQETGNQNVKPTVTTYNTLIQAWANSEDPQKGQHALDVLSRMEEPNTRSFNSVMSALSRSNHSRKMELIFDLLNYLEGAYISGEDDVVGPDTITFNTALNALAKSGDAKAAEKAESILHRMLTYEREGSTAISPNTITYNTVMNIIAKSKSIQDGALRVESILDHMEELYRESGNSLIAPSSVSYSTCIMAWARSQRPDKVIRARSILDRMKSAHHDSKMNNKTFIIPDIIPYNTLLNACCFSVGNTDSRFEAANATMEILHEIRDSNFAKPETLTYTTAVKALGRNIPPGIERNKLVEQVIQLCTDDGLMCEKVAKEVRHASKEVFHKYFGNKRFN